MTNDNQVHQLSEADIEALVSDPQTLAAIDAYARDEITLHQTIALAAEGRDFLVPKQYHANLVQYLRLIHEIARRIRSNRIAVSSDTRGRLSGPGRLLPLTPSDPPLHVYKYAFSKNESLPDELNALIVRRDCYDEDDISALIADLRFLALADSLRQGIINRIEFWIRFSSRKSIYPPRRLSQQAFRDVIDEVGARMADGRIALPADLRAKYEFAYEPAPKDVDRAYT
jgi:hypothetical protein